MRTVDNPAFSAEAHDAVNDIMQSIQGHADKTRKAYQIGIAHAMCIRAAIAPDHYLIGCASQCASTAAVVTLTEKWIAQRGADHG